MKFLTAVTCLLVLHAKIASAVTIDTVPVGNPGNAADPATGNLFGSVSYEYRIGTTEVTNAQYVEFLNAKAASDPLGLYSTYMGDQVSGGITRSGSDGSYSYSAKTNMGNKPVNFVDWYDAMRSGRRGFAVQESNSANCSRNRVPIEKGGPLWMWRTGRAARHIPEAASQGSPHGRQVHGCPSQARSFWSARA